MPPPRAEARDYGGLGAGQGIGGSVKEAVGRGAAGVGPSGVATAEGRRLEAGGWKVEEDLPGATAAG